jgi:hypothetical protein
MATRFGSIGSYSYISAVFNALLRHLLMFLPFHLLRTMKDSIFLHKFVFLLVHLSHLLRPLHLFYLSHIFLLFHLFIAMSEHVSVHGIPGVHGLFLMPYR